MMSYITTYFLNLTYVLTMKRISKNFNVNVMNRKEVKFKKKLDFNKDECFTKRIVEKGELNGF